MTPQIAGQRAGPAKHRAGTDDRNLDRSNRTRHRSVTVIKFDARRVKLPPVSQVDVWHNERIGGAAAAFDDSDEAFRIALELVPNQLRVFVACRGRVDLLVGRVIARPAVHSRGKRADRGQDDWHRQISPGQKLKVVQPGCSAQSLVGGPDFQPFRVGKHFFELGEGTFKRNPIGFLYRCRESLPPRIYLRRSGTDPAPSAFITKNSQLNQKVDVGPPGNAGDVKNKARVR